MADPFAGTGFGSNATNLSDPFAGSGYSGGNIMDLAGFQNAGGLSRSVLDGLQHYEVLVYSKRRDSSLVDVRAYLPEEFAFDTESEYNAPFEKGILSGTGFVGSVAQLAGYSLITQFLTQQLWQGSSPITFSLPLEFVADGDAGKEVIDKILDLSALCMPSVENGILRSPGPVLSLENNAVGARNRADLEKVPAYFSKSVTDIVNTQSSAFSSGDGWMGGAENMVKAIPTTIDQAQTGLAAISSGMSDLNRYVNVVQLTIGNFLLFPSVIVKSVRQTWTTQPDRHGKMMRAKADVTFSTHMTLTAEDLRKVFLR